MSTMRRQRRAALRALDKKMAKAMRGKDLSLAEDFIEATEVLFGKADKQPKTDYSAIKCSCKGVDAKDCNC